MEIDALYCDVIVERWQRFTGKKAQRLDAAGRRASGSEQRNSTR
jgi:DNA modification methylase